MTVLSVGNCGQADISAFPAMTSVSKLCTFCESERSSSASHNSGDLLGSDVVLDRKVSRPGSRKPLTCDVLLNFGRCSPWSPALTADPTLSGHVGHVLSMCATREVGKVHTWRVVARMPHKPPTHVLYAHTVGHCPRCHMCTHNTVPGYPKLPVPITCRTSCPKLTLCGFHISHHNHVS